MCLDECLAATHPPTIKRIRAKPWDSNHANRGLRDRNSPTCTLSQNGYGAWNAWAGAYRTRPREHSGRKLRNAQLCVCVCWRGSQPEQEISLKKTGPSLGCQFRNENVLELEAAGMGCFIELSHITTYLTIRPANLIC